MQHCRMNSIHPAIIAWNTRVIRKLTDVVHGRTITLRFIHAGLEYLIIIGTLFLENIVSWSPSTILRLIY